MDLRARALSKHLFRYLLDTRFYTLALPSRQVSVQTLPGLGGHSLERLDKRKKCSVHRDARYQ